MGDDASIIVPADNMQFGEFCTLLEELYNINNSSKKSKKEEQEKVLYDYINNFRINAVNIDGRKVICIFFIKLNYYTFAFDCKRSLLVLTKEI